MGWEVSNYDHDHDRKSHGIPTIRTRWDELPWNPMFGFFLVRPELGGIDKHESS